MNQKSIISIIITCYNNRPHIEEAIKSVADQSVLTEIIVVDDCSTDDSWEFLQSIQTKYDLILKQSEKNLGMAGARNFGFKFINGEFVNFLDGDDYFLPKKLDIQLDYLVEHPEINACYTDSKLLTGNKLATFTLKDVWASQSGDIFSSLLSGNFIAIHAALFRTKALSTRPFDITMRHAADYDFWLNFARHNQVDFIDRPLVVYRRTGKTNTVTNRLPLINETIGILSSWREYKLTPNQKHNLKVHQSLNYVTRANYHLSHNDSSSGYADLVRADELATLTGKHKLIFNVMSINKKLGLLLFRLGRALSSFKNLLKTITGRERRFI